MIDIVTALAILPNDPDEIASRLASESCFGVHENTSCPLALYLHNKTGEYMVRISRNYCWRPDQTNWRDIETELPRAVSEFVDGFDVGRYPFLEKE